MDRPGRQALYAGLAGCLAVVLLVAGLMSWQPTPKDEGPETIDPSRAGPSSDAADGDVASETPDGTRTAPDPRDAPSPDPADAEDTAAEDVDGPSATDPIIPGTPTGPPDPMDAADPLEPLGPVPLPTTDAPVPSLPLPTTSPPVPSVPVPPPQLPGLPPLPSFP